MFNNTYEIKGKMPGCGEAFACRRTLWTTMLIIYYLIRDKGCYKFEIQIK